MTVIKLETAIPMVRLLLAISLANLQKSNIPRILLLFHWPIAS